MQFSQRHVFHAVYWHLKTENLDFAKVQLYLKGWTHEDPTPAISFPRATGISSVAKFQSAGTGLSRAVRSLDMDPDCHVHSYASHGPASRIEAADKGQGVA
jgi:hypothetical protein